MIAPEEEKYQIMEPNFPNYMNVELLPDLLPVYIKVSCAGQRSPCQLEIVMDGLDAIQVLVSNEHKFPKEEGQLFEKEKLLINHDIVPAESLKKGKGDNKVKKTSILLIEAASQALKNPQGKVDLGLVRRGSGTSILARQKKHILFSKAGFKDEFNLEDNMYIAILSQTGGTAQLKANFPN